MRSVRVKVIAEADGELRLSNLPVQKGDTVEAIVILPGGMPDTQRQRCRADFLKHASSSDFRSSGTYPAREELHERS